MEYDRILIRYGEISTKGKNRNKFVDKLKKSIKSALTPFPNVKIEAGRDRMYVVLNGESTQGVIKGLRKIFGIQSFSPAVKVKRDIEIMKDTALQLVKSIYTDGQTFKVSARRSDKSFALDTNEINHALGAHILKNMPDIKVKVKLPNIDLKVEVRDEAVYLSCETILGAGGLPAGSSGKAMLMLSGGIDSPVAGYLSMKRGIDIEVVHFFSPPYTSERAKEKVIDLSRKLAEINGRIKVHIVPFTKIQEAIRDQVPENYTMTTTRRLMLRIADVIREKQGALAIITGESIGQVASQTLESMFAINAVTNTPLLRPLIMMDKPDIIKIAQEIDTFDISNRPFEDCCTIFVPAAPKTRPKKEKVEFYESFLDFEPFIRQAVETMETIIVQPGNQLEPEVQELF